MKEKVDWDSSDNDDDEHEEVFTLGRMSTRSQTRVNQYFTNTEIEDKTDSNDNNGDNDEGPETGFGPSDDGDLDVADENMVEL